MIIISFESLKYQIVKPIIFYHCGYMNRKNQDNEATNEENPPQTIFPKFAANWTNIVRLDRIVMNISGTFPMRSRLLVRSCPKSRKRTQMENQNRSE
jgi:hypothetical protein